jgi:hypothetical protein
MLIYILWEKQGHISTEEHFENSKSVEILIFTYNN